jgi:phosphonate transport system substrate-binding protein
MMRPMSEAEGDVTFAIISIAPAASALLETVCDELTKHTRFQIKPLVVRSYDKLLGGMQGGDVHVAWAPPLVAIDLERAKVGKIRLCSRRAGKPDYSCALFVKKDSPIQSLKDLTDKRIAWVAKESSAGFVVPRLKLLAEGIDPDKAFKEQSFRRTHEAVTRAVMAGDADVGATYVHLDADGKPTSAGWTEAGVDTAEVRIIATAGPIPSDVIAVSSTLAGDKADLITAGLRELGESVLKLLNADGFDVPEDAHFDKLRALVADAGQAKPS